MTDLVRWARELQAIAQSGLTYTESPYERERFQAVQAVAVQIAAAAGGEEVAELHERFAVEYGYGTPKVYVRGVVVTEAGLLLVQEIGDTRWTLPGGWADVGHSPAKAVEKEVREEAGIESAAERVLAVLDRDFRGKARFPAHAYKMYVSCRAQSATPPRRATASRPRSRATSRSTRCPSLHQEPARAPRARPASCPRPHGAGADRLTDGFSWSGSGWPGRIRLGPEGASGCAAWCSPRTRVPGSASSRTGAGGSRVGSGLGL